MSYPMRKYGDFMLVNPIDATGSGYKRYNPYYRNYRRGGAFGDHVRKFTRGVGRAAKKGYSIFKNAAHGVNGAMALLNLATRGANRTSPVQYFQMGTGTLVALKWLIRMCRYLRSNNPPPEENEELRRLTQELARSQELIRGLMARLEAADRDLNCPTMFLPMCTTQCLCSFSGNTSLNAGTSPVPLSDMNVIVSHSPRTRLA